MFNNEQSPDWTTSSIQRKLPKMSPKDCATTHKSLILSESCSVAGRCWLRNVVSGAKSILIFQPCRIVSKCAKKMVTKQIFFSKTALSLQYHPKLSVHVWILSIQSYLYEQSLFHDFWNMILEILFWTAFFLYVFYIHCHHLALICELDTNIYYVEYIVFLMFRIDF